MKKKLAKRGRPRKSKDEQQLLQIGLRVTTAEKAAYSAAARLDNRTVSQWIRDRLGKIIKQELQSADACEMQKR